MFCLIFLGQHIYNWLYFLLICECFLRFWRVTVTVTKLCHWFSCSERVDFAVFIICGSAKHTKKSKNFIFCKSLLRKTVSKFGHGNGNVNKNVNAAFKKNIIYLEQWRILGVATLHLGKIQ